MRCIFCESSVNTFTSAEHIIPESLGNTKTILPPGIVCDKCNNYFARKVEAELLNSDFFKFARFRNAIPSKKGKIPNLEPILGPDSSVLGMYKTTNGLQGIYPLDIKSEQSFISHLDEHKSGTISYPIPRKVNTYSMSRLLAKIGIELLTSRVINAPGWEEEVIFKPELDALRKYARYGSQVFEWQFYERRIYDENVPIKDENGNLYEILNEMDLLFSNGQFLFSVVCIFGIEYTIDMANPDIKLYKNWLKKNNYKSPLYSNKYKNIHCQQIGYL